VKSALISWLRAKNPVLLFVVAFALLLGVFYGLTLTPLFKNKLFPAYLRSNARVSSAILRGMGYPCVSVGTSVTTGSFSIEIRRGCDAVEPTALFAAAVLAFPGLFRRKAVGVLVGTVVLALLNLVRILSLFLIGVHAPRFFEAMHADVWQAFFILLALVLWGLWIQWAMKPRPSAAHVPG
jgi:exosortase H (IPTLxxWG-CTERM-specific)